MIRGVLIFFFFSSRRRHTRFSRDWSSDVCSSDLEFRIKSHRRIDELRAQAGTVFLVAHNLGEIEETCNRVIWLEKGQIVQAGSNVAEIIDAYLEATGGEPRVREPAKG